MKKILILIILLVSCNIGFSQTPQKWNLGKTRITDSVLANGKYETTIKSDSSIRMSGYMFIPNRINGDIDITGLFKVNGTAISTGGGDVFKSQKNNFTFPNVFSDSTIFEDEVFIGDNLLMRFGNYSIFPNVGLRGYANSMEYLGNAHYFKTEYDNPFLQIDSTEGIKLMAGNYRIGTKTLLDSILNTRNTFLEKTTFSDTLRATNYVLFDSLKVFNKINSTDIDITGTYKVNGVPITTGGGDVFKNSKNEFTFPNVFTDSTIFQDEVFIGDNLLMRFGNYSIFPNVGLRGNTNSMEYLGNTHNFRTEYDNTIALIDTNGINILTGSKFTINSVSILDTSLTDENIYKTNNLDTSNISFLNQRNTFVKRTLFSDSLRATAIVNFDSMKVSGQVNSGSLITNTVNASSSITATDFTGSGTNITDLDANNLVIGTVNNSLLNSNVAIHGTNLDTTITPKLSMNNTFTGTNVFTGFGDFRKKIGVDTITVSGNGGSPSDLEITAGDSIRLNSNTKLNGKSLSIDGSNKSNVTVFGNSSLKFKSGGNDTIKTTDDYNLILGTADTSRITISNRGDITFPNQQKTYGVWYRDGKRFMHTTKPIGSPDTVNSIVSYNLFLGTEAGSVNPSFSSYGVRGYEGNYNIGIGTWALKSLTTGHYNFMIGSFSGSLITSGSSNFGMGNYNLTNLTTGVGNLALGNNAMQYSGTAVWGNTMIGASSGTGVAGTSSYWQNTAIGISTLARITTGTKNIVIGSLAGGSITSGSYNIIISPQSYDQYGQYFNRGKTTTGNYNILIGDSTVRVYNTNGSIGLSIDSTASKHLNIGQTFFARDIYTDTVKTGIGIREDSITARLHIKAGQTQRHTAPLKFNSGSLLTTPEVGAVEFLTDNLYYTQTTNTSRNRIAINRSDTLSTYASSVSVTMDGSLKRVTHSQNCTLNATGGVIGSSIVFAFTNASGSAKTITFGTNFKSMGVVTVNGATGADDEATVTFMCLDGTTWIETARSVGM